MHHLAVWFVLLLSHHWRNSLVDDICGFALATRGVEYQWREGSSLYFSNSFVVGSSLLQLISLIALS